MLLILENSSQSMTASIYALRRLLAAAMLSRQNDTISEFLTVRIHLSGISPRTASRISLFWANVTAEKKAICILPGRRIDPTTATCAISCARIMRSAAYTVKVPPEQVARLRGYPSSNLVQMFVDTSFQTQA
jgi:hypothetical protein